MHHHIFPWLRPNLLDPLLTCVDAAAVLHFALQHRAQAIVHGHKHMPYVRVLEDAGRKLFIVSCGSALYPAKGPCEKEVGAPSCMGLLLKDGSVGDVILFRDSAG